MNRPTREDVNDMKEAWGDEIDGLTELCDAYLDLETENERLGGIIAELRTEMLNYENLQVVSALDHTAIAALKAEISALKAQLPHD